MSYTRIDPPSALRRAVECVWIVADDSTKPEIQKIIPDGFVELIFHFGDPFKIRLYDRWSRQAYSLFAPQITKHFHLQNTGKTEILGLKLHPTVAAHVFGISMEKTADSVVPLKSLRLKELNRLDQLVRAEKTMNHRVGVMLNEVARWSDRVPEKHFVDISVERIFETHGLVSVADLCRHTGVGERHLEKGFQKLVGISPKYFARIVRFNYVFEVIEQHAPDWQEIVFRAGYYDQSHFIRNFKAFTGEDPSRYLFGESNLANFFLKRGK